jgi:Peptidase family M1 domain
MNKYLLFFYFITISILAQDNQQIPVFTKSDSLRGAITPERAWWDLKYYDLNVEVIPSTKTFIGKNSIYYQVLDTNQIMQIDMQYPMQIQYAIQQKDTLLLKRLGNNVYYVYFKKKQIIGKNEKVDLYFAGQPKVAVKPPWDGGVQWTKDAKGIDYIATSCQELGASVWWPCKDHMYDEPDSMQISITVPKGLKDVSNGKLRKVVENQNNTTTFVWFVANPINNYGVNINVGNYMSWSETYKGEKGDLDLSYYVLPLDYDKAKVQFKEVPRMLKAFEFWFGPYPFYEDGYKLVQVPYLGMEHQSSVTYGNKFANGYLGRDLSGSGWGLLWDFIIVHESGHEWFANNITYKDIADMWIHESFTNYSENLFTEYYFGKKAGSEYVVGTRKNITNNIPIIGIYDVNQPGAQPDMYYKGGNMLHTIRQIVNNDDKWRGILRGLNKEFYHQTVTTAQIENYISENIGHSIQKIFDQYLRTTQIPVLEYKLKGKILEYRWQNCVVGFDMPLKADLGNKEVNWLYPTTEWQKFKNKKKVTFKQDINFYVKAKKL